MVAGARVLMPAVPRWIATHVKVPEKKTARMDAEILDSSLAKRSLIQLHVQSQTSLTASQQVRRLLFTKDYCCR